MQDQIDTIPAHTGSTDIGNGDFLSAPRNTNSATLPILPHILAAIFGVFAIAIVILWLSISVWSRPDPHHLTPANAQQPAGRTLGTAP
ncbi:hypothetical protein [Novosphingobium sp.]|uniref:hypothetical protein n=1 Tax=Novosphingobium sp. TaxID=1874826 RepID=UPI0028B22688|nr:hypothetical protein [Novosphingobium sp.]